MAAPCKGAIWVAPGETWGKKDRYFSPPNRGIGLEYKMSRGGIEVIIFQTLFPVHLVLIRREPDRSQNEPIPNSRDWQGFNPGNEAVLR